MASLKLSEVTIRAGATEKSFAGGRELFRRGAVSRAAIQGRTLSGVFRQRQDRTVQAQGGGRWGLQAARERHYARPRPHARLRGLLARQRPC